MWLKEQSEKLIPPPVNFRTEDGATIFNFDLDRELMMQYGWRDWTSDEIAAWKEAHPAPEPPRQTVFSKLAIRRAMRSLGIEAKLDALLSSSDTFRADWTDTQEIDLSDPVLMEALASGGGITADDIEAVRNAITGA